MTRFKTFLAALCLSCFVSFANAQSPKTINLTILHTNDTHGHLLPYSYPVSDDPSFEQTHLVAQRDIGGAARRGTMIQKIRQEKDHGTLLLDAGDICDGTPFSVEYHGEADVAVMNALGYDAGCPGNHEFNNKLAQSLKLKSLAKYPVLCANVRLKEGNKEAYLPYVIKSISGLKVGIYGLTTMEGATYPAGKEGLVFEEPIAASQRIVPELRKQCDIVVAVTHIGVDEDQKLAAAVKGIDVIVGGHSHTMLPHGLQIAPYKQSNYRQTTVIVQNFQWAGTLGRLDLKILKEKNGTCHVDSFNANLLPVLSSTPPDPAVAKVVSTFWNPILFKYAEVVGNAANDFTERGQDKAQYNLVADAVLDSFKLDFDLENNGGVRAPLVKGPVTYGDLLTMDPFGNTIVTFKVMGRDLKTLLLKWKPSVSGIRYKVKGAELSEATVGGLAIADTRVYEGVTNSYLASQIGFKEVITDIVDTKKPRLDAVKKYLKKSREIVPKYDGRVEIIN